MTNIVKFPRNKIWNPKPIKLYRWISPAKYLAIFIAVTIVVGILTAITGPAAFLIMAVVFMIYTMIYLP